MMFDLTGEAGSYLKNGPEPLSPGMCRRGCRERSLSSRLHYRMKKAEKPDKARTMPLGKPQGFTLLMTRWLQRWGGSARTWSKVTGQPMGTYCMPRARGAALKMRLSSGLGRVSGKCLPIHGTGCPPRPAQPLTHPTSGQIAGILHPDSSSSLPRRSGSPSLSRLRLAEGC